MNLGGRRIVHDENLLPSELRKVLVETQLKISTSNSFILAFGLLVREQWGIKNNEAGMRHIARAAVFEQSKVNAE